MRLADSGWIAEIVEAEKQGVSPNNVTLIKQAWLRTVNRRPSQDEIARATQHLANVDSLAEGMSDLLWAMLNTKEFLLNH